jgi:hypothetical protein
MDIVIARIPGDELVEGDPVMLLGIFTAHEDPEEPVNSGQIPRFYIELAREIDLSVQGLNIEREIKLDLAHDPACRVTGDPAKRAVQGTVYLPMGASITAAEHVNAEIIFESIFFMRRASATREWVRFKEDNFIADFSQQCRSGAPARS